VRADQVNGEPALRVWGVPTSSSFACGQVIHGHIHERH
jgi:hypothetical protein